MSISKISLNEITKSGNYSFGQPKQFSFSSQGVYFLRSDTPFDKKQQLIFYDIHTNKEIHISSHRNETSSQDTTGVLSFHVNKERNEVVFTQNKKTYIWSQSICTEITQLQQCILPTFSPDGRYISCLLNAKLSIFNRKTKTLATIQDDRNQHFGEVDYISKEEFNRNDGFWWSPCSSYLIFQSSENSELPTWSVSDISKPEHNVVTYPYAQAGKNNTRIEIHFVNIQDVDSQAYRIQTLEYEMESYPYLVKATQQYLFFLTRDQKKLIVTCVDFSNATMTTVFEQEDPYWITMLRNLPFQNKHNNWIHYIDNYETNTRNLGIDHKEYPLFSPEDNSALSILECIGESETGCYLLCYKNPLYHEIIHYAWNNNITSIAKQNVLKAWANDSNILWAEGVSHTPHIHYLMNTKNKTVMIKDNSEIPNVPINKTYFTHDHETQITPSSHNSAVTKINLTNYSCVIIPGNIEDYDQPLPLVCSPYGGPHGQRVTHNSCTNVKDQWLADQGFIILITDGRGCESQSVLSEKSIYQNFLPGIVEDQVAAVEKLIRTFPGVIDGNNVGIHGWSFGGYITLACLALAGDIFHAGFAGAPVTDWLLYDTAYTERYLTHPDTAIDVYKKNSLLEYIDAITQPLYLVHGMCDDNVHITHTLQVSNFLNKKNISHQLQLLPQTGHRDLTPELQEHLAYSMKNFFVQHLAPPTLPSL